MSADGLTWTFSLRRGLRYAPPYDDVEVTAGDVVRSLERMIRPAPEWREPGGAPSYGPGASAYADIVGYDEFVAGETDTIAGLERRTTTRSSSRWSARAASSATCSRSR